MGVGTNSEAWGPFVAPRLHSCQRTLPSVTSADSRTYNPVSDNQTYTT